MHLRLQLDVLAQSARSCAARRPAKGWLVRLTSCAASQRQGQRSAVCCPEHDQTDGEASSSPSLKQHVTGSAVGAAAGTAAAVAILGQGAAVVVSPLGAALVAAGAMGGAVVGELLLGAADSDDMETDNDVEQGMESAADKVVATIRQARASGTLHGNPGHSHAAADAPASATAGQHTVRQERPRQGAPGAGAADGRADGSHTGAQVAGAVAGSAAVLAASGAGARTAAGVGGAAAGAVAGAVAGDLLLGRAKEEEFETDRDLERGMDEAADKVVEGLRQAKAEGEGTLRTVRGAAAAAAGGGGGPPADTAGEA